MSTRLATYMTKRNIHVKIMYPISEAGSTNIDHECNGVE
jgi:hypothetical protein